MAAPRATHLSVCFEEDVGQEHKKKQVLEMVL